MRRTQIYLADDQDGRLAARARAAGASKSTLIREAVEAYLDTTGADDRLVAFRAALDRIERTTASLPDGASYVEDVRAVDTGRDTELEQRRR